MNVAATPRDQLSGAGALVLKLFALVVMVGDHVDWFLLGGSAGFNATWGRSVFPLFAFLLAINLARPDDAGSLALKLVRRLLIFGALAHPAYTLLQGQGLPLNIMFALAAAVAVVGLIARGWPVCALLVFVGAGVFVDYNWLGLAAVVAPWIALRVGAGLYCALALTCVLLSIYCGTAWPFVAVPLLGLALLVEGDAPRWRWLFYVAYPVHLALIAGIASTFG